LPRIAWQTAQCSVASSTSERSSLCRERRHAHREVARSQAVVAGVVTSLEPHTRFGDDVD
jgi:hypothetical protein